MNNEHGNSMGETEILLGQVLDLQARLCVRSQALIGSKLSLHRCNWISLGFFKLEGNPGSLSEVFA